MQLVLIKILVQSYGSTSPYGCWCLVWLFQPHSGLVIPQNCNSKKRLATARSTQEDWKGSARRQCLALQPPGFSAGGLLPRHVPKRGAGAEETPQPPAHCHSVVSPVSIPFLSPDPGCGCCRQPDAGTAAAVLLIPAGMISPNGDPWEISTECRNRAAEQRLRL